MVNVKAENKVLRINSFIRRGGEAYLRLHITGTMNSYGERKQISRLRNKNGQLQAHDIWAGKWVDISDDDLIDT